MRKTLLAVAFAGAAIAPTVALTAAATLAPTGAAVAAPNSKAVKIQRPLVRKPIRGLTIRCFWPRTSVRRERLRLRHAGYRHVKYTGTSYFRPRCAKFMRFTACKRGTRYRVTVRYIKHRRYVIAQPLGRCYILRRNPALRRHSS